MRRRELLCSIAGVTIIWAGPIIAQPADQVRRIGIFHAYEETDPEERAQISAFRDELSKLGWVEGRNVVVNLKAGAVEAEALLPIARELLAKKPDVVVGEGGTIVAALQRASRSVPIVFVNVTALWQAWPIPVITPRDSRYLNLASARNGSNCSKRLRLT